MKQLLSYHFICSVYLLILLKDHLFLYSDEK